MEVKDSGHREMHSPAKPALSSGLFMLECAIHDDAPQLILSGNVLNKPTQEGLSLS